MATVKSFLLPDLGEGLSEAEFLKWLVAVGDTVELNQEIAQVETAKSAVDLPTPYAGKVVALRVEEGTTVDVGSPIIDIEVAESNSAPVQPVPPAQTGSAQDSPPAQEKVPAPTPVLVGYGVSAESGSRRRRRPAAPTEQAHADPRPADLSLVAQVPSDRVLAAPPVRFLAREQGIDLHDVAPSGVHGEVTRADVEAYQRAQQRPQVVNPRSAQEIRIPIKGVRKHTAAAMVRSAFSAPHVTELLTIDITPTLELMAELRQSSHFQSVRLTPLTFVAKALLVALRDNPSLNSSWDEANQEIVTKSYVNLGIAAATPRGLMVPTIGDAHLLGLRDVAQAISSLTETAKAGDFSQQQLSGGTITITNIGVFGVDSGTPILNPGEAAILCFGAIRRLPWEHRGEVALRSVTTLSLSFDHRMVDGAEGSRFLAAVGQILSDPLTLTALS